MDSDFSRKSKLDEIFNSLVKVKVSESEAGIDCVLEFLEYENL